MLRFSLRRQPPRQGSEHDVFVCRLLPAHRHARAAHRRVAQGVGGLRAASRLAWWRAPAIRNKLVHSQRFFVTRVLSFLRHLHAVTAHDSNQLFSVLVGLYAPTSAIQDRHAKAVPRNNVSVNEGADAPCTQLLVCIVAGVLVRTLKAVVAGEVFVAGPSFKGQVPGTAKLLILRVLLIEEV